MTLLACVLVVGVGVQFLPWRVQENPSILRAISQLDGEFVGRTAPDFELVDLDGRTRRLSDFRGEVVFLNFWASFCEPCREEMPSMESIIRQYQQEGLVMVAVSFDAEVEHAQGFMQQFLPGERSAMTVLWDPTSGTGHQFGTELIPETYIIDRDGRIVARFVSAYDWTRPEVKMLIEGLLRTKRQDRRWF